MSYISVYTTRAFLENAGIPVQGWSNARLNEAIVQAGSAIDGLTAQRFIPYEETFVLSGDERTIIHRPDLLPILSISSIEIDWNLSNRRNKVYHGVLGDVAIPRPYGYGTSATLLGGTYSFGSDSYRLKYAPLPRIIEAVGSPFPGGVQNISITGVTGWPEVASIKTTAFETTTTTDITSNSTTVTLTSVTGLKLRDVMLIGELPFIAQSISGNVVTIDPPDGLLTSTIAAGAAVESYGAVPRGIQRVTNFFVMQEYQRQSQWESGNFVDPETIASETTDKYSYKRFTPIQMVAAGRSPGMTGVAIIDEIIMDHCPPPIIHFA